MARSRKPLPPPAPGESPVGAIPAPILVLFLAIAAVEAGLSLADLGYAGGAAGVGWRVGLIERWAVSPAVLEHARLRPDAGLLARFVLYPLVHGGAVHALFAGALLLALGKFVGDAIGGLRAFLVFLAGTVGGAVAYGLLAGGTYPLFGAYPGVYGLIGGFTLLMWLSLGAMGASRLGAFRLIGALLAIQLLFGLLFGADPTWRADLGGFAAGGAAAMLLAPGGWRAVAARMRAR